MSIEVGTVGLYLLTAAAMASAVILYWRLSLRAHQAKRDCVVAIGDPFWDPTILETADLEDLQELLAANKSSLVRRAHLAQLLMASQGAGTSAEHHLLLIVLLSGGGPGSCRLAANTLLPHILQTESEDVCKQVFGNLLPPKLRRNAGRLEEEYRAYVKSVINQRDSDDG